MREEIADKVGEDRRLFIEHTECEAHKTEIK